MVHVRVIVASLALLVSRADTARACTCFSTNAFDLPADGATDVPTNLREIYFEANYGSDGVRLRAADGEEIDAGPARLAPGYKFSLYIADIPSELRPNTRYALWNEHSRSSELLLEFTTGSGPDHLAPPAARFEGFRIEYIGDEDFDSCGRETARIGGYVAARRDDDIAAAVVRFVRPDGESDERILPTAPTGRLVATGETVWFPSILGTHYCQVQLELIEDESYLVEAWTIDRAGNPSDVTTQEMAVERAGCASARSGSIGSGLLALGLALVSRQRRRRT